MVLRLHRLIYCSQSLLPTGAEAVDLGIAEILRASRINNARQQITGALAFNSGVFAQVLEGPTAQLESTFERIQRDDRHNRVQVLALDEIRDRAFPDWSMVVIGCSREGRDKLSHIAGAAGFTDKRREGDRILQTMLAVATQEDRVV